MAVVRLVQITIEDPVGLRLYFGQIRAYLPHTKLIFFGKISLYSKEKKIDKLVQIYPDDSKNGGKVYIIYMP